MKRILIGLGALLLVGTSSYSLENRSAVVKLGAIATGEVDTDTGAGDEDLEANLSVALEYMLRWESGFDVGVGAAFEKHELKSSQFRFGLNEVNSYPVYGILRYRFKTWENWSPYIYGNLGYAFADEDRVGTSIDDGMYYGAGVGIEYIENFGFEMGWARTEFDGRDIDGNSFDPTSDVFKVSITMRLDH